MGGSGSARGEMLNQDLNPTTLAREFAVKKRIQIANALEPVVAEKISEILTRNTPWMLAFNRGKESVKLDAGQMAAMGREKLGAQMQECLRDAQTGFQYVYSSYPIVEAIVAGRDAGHPLHGVLEEINAPPFRSFVERVTGIQGLVRADGQATLYTRGHFLTLHNDFDEGNKRRVAYVLGFTRKWRTDWGGLLEFYDERGNVEWGALPRFNVLTMFQVPVNHAVTFVPPYVTEGRYSITGWFSVA